MILEGGGSLCLQGRVVLIGYKYTSCAMTASVSSGQMFSSCKRNAMGF